MSNATPTITRRSVAGQARAFGRANELGHKCLGEGARGRVPADLVFQYLKSQAPKSVRQVADALGVEHTGKGKISETLLVAVTDTVVKNAPKA